MQIKSYTGSFVLKYIWHDRFEIKFLKIAGTYDYLTRRMYLPELGLYYLHS